MKILDWELSVLSRAVRFQNLSTAADHVGVSQSQLSRMVKRLEEEHGVMLLRRESKRSAHWTAEANQLVEIYHRAHERFESDVFALSQTGRFDHLRVGALEGLGVYAFDRLWSLLGKNSLEVLTLDLLDLDDLEAGLLRGDYDVILTIKPVGQRKFPLFETLGYQTLDDRKSGSGSFRVLSSFEAHTREGEAVQGKRMISNSLFLRRHVFEKHGGLARIPSAISARKKSGEDVSVLLIGTERVPKKLRDEIYSALAKS